MIPTLLAWVSLARGDCPRGADPVSPNDATQRIDAALADGALLPEERPALAAAIGCLDGPVHPEAWARVQRQLLVQQLAAGEHWQGPLRSLAWSDPAAVPSGGWSHLPDAPAVPPTRWTQGFDPPEPSPVLLDGRAAPPSGFFLDGDHVVQVRSGRKLATAWVVDGALPQGWTRSGPGHRSPRTAGAAMVGAGLAIGGTCVALDATLGRAPYGAPWLEAASVQAVAALTGTVLLIVDAVRHRPAPGLRTWVEAAP